MERDVEEALFQVFELEASAAEEQKKRGGEQDRGRRSGVTAGRHMDPLAECIASRLASYGMGRTDAMTGRSGMEIPGWFRPNKQWDILAFCRESLVAAIELKSIGSSYGNNFNNRTEEALGSATDASAAVRYGMFPQTQPPMFGYVMVVRSDAKSRSVIRHVPEPHFAVDPAFGNGSYLDRFRILCTRMLSERIYDAIWLVFVDTDNHTIDEPVRELSFEKFMLRLKMQTEIFG